MKASSTSELQKKKLYLEMLSKMEKRGETCSRIRDIYFTLLFVSVMCSLYRTTHTHTHCCAYNAWQQSTSNSPGRILKKGFLKKIINKLSQKNQNSFSVSCILQKRSHSDIQWPLHSEQQSLLTLQPGGLVNKLGSDTELPSGLILHFKI